MLQPLQVSVSQRLWNFSFIGPDYNCYYHRNFFRGRPELIPLILRLESSGNKSKSNGDGDETEGADFNGEGETFLVLGEIVSILVPVGRIYNQVKSC